MLDSRHLWHLATRLPRLFSGTALHRLGLEASYRGDYPTSDRLFEAAGSRYRRDLAVEFLARLRVHQLIARARSLENPERDAEICLEVERLLTRLDFIESLDPPFRLVEASSMLANWLSVTDGAGGERDAIRRAA